MSPAPSPELYSLREIALAARVSEAEVIAAIRSGVGEKWSIPVSTRSIPFDDAVRIGRALALGSRAKPAAPQLFSHWESTTQPRQAALPLALSSTFHVGFLMLAIFLTTFDLTPRAAAFRGETETFDPMRLVFFATPGPGGGGGGGGLLRPTPAPTAMREGHHPISSPVPERSRPKLAEQNRVIPPPKASSPLAAEPLPVLIAPIVTVAADERDRPGVLERSPSEADTRGQGRAGGAGTGAGTGLGSGDGSGVGPGSGGGMGGGPYRPGSGVTPPKLLREVKADYTEDARQRGIGGEVVMEIVVRRDGTVGEVRLLQGLGGGLNERAAQAVRRWRFLPAERLGVPVDVIVEVAVEFKLR
jgi:periplasmic protein TonB